MELAGLAIWLVALLALGINWAYLHAIRRERKQLKLLVKELIRHIQRTRR